MWGGAYFQRVNHAPTARGRCPSAPQFWGFPSIYVALWRSGRVLAMRSIGWGFESQPPRCRVQPWTC